MKQKVETASFCVKMDKITLKRCLAFVTILYHMFEENIQI